MGGSKQQAGMQKQKLPIYFDAALQLTWNSPSYVNGRKNPQQSLF